MAIKLSASLSKKVPIEGLQYSSQSFGGSLEIEIGTDDPNEIKQRLHHLYDSLSLSIDSEIAAASSGRPTAPATRFQAAPPPLPAPRTGTANAGQPARTNGNGRRSTATEAQQRAIFAIAKNLNIDMAALLAQHGVADVAMLPIKSASMIIDQLKSQQNGTAARR